MIRIFLLSLFLFSGLSSFSQEKKNFSWLFIYYMPYDNNLSEFGSGIVQEMKAGLQNDSIAIVIQADFMDTIPSQRILITKDSIYYFECSIENFSSPDSYRQYLSWVRTNFEFHHSALVFLDHGGRLNEICLDENPENSYLKTDSLKKIIFNFNQTNLKQPEFIFLQVCAKSVLEPLYDFSGLTPYTVCSQNTLGAPNHYYTGFFEFLSENTTISVKKLISKIPAYETNDMYYSYTLIDNSKWDLFLFSFNKWIKSLGNFQIESDKINSIKYMDETHWDLVSFIHLTPKGSKKEQERRIELMKQLDSLILLHAINPVHDQMEKYAGLSILALNHSAYEQFKTMAVYQQLNLFKLREKMTFVLTNKSEQKSINFR